MNSLKKVFPVMFLGAMMIIGGILFSEFSTPKTVLGDSGTPNTIKTMNVSKGVSVSTTSVQLLPASSGRIYAVIVNNGASPVYLSLNGSAAVAGTGIRLNASGGSYEINLSNQYIGIINAITTSGTSNVTVSAAQ